MNLDFQPVLPELHLLFLGSELECNFIKNSLNKIQLREIKILLYDSPYFCAMSLSLSIKISIQRKFTSESLT